jgi:hypothetical protein
VNNGATASTTAWVLAVVLALAVVVLCCALLWPV